MRKYPAVSEHSHIHACRYQGLGIANRDSHMHSAMAGKGQGSSMMKIGVASMSSSSTEVRSKIYIIDNKLQGEAEGPVQDIYSME